MRTAKGIQGENNVHLETDLDEKEKENYHSEEMTEIIGVPPPWIITWGTTGFLGMLMLFVSLTAFIHYPDLVRSNLRLISKNSPKPVVTKLGGKIVEILVLDGQIILESQPLAYIESSADHKLVLKIDESLKKMQDEFTSSGDVKPTYEFSPFQLSMSELQESYQVFYQSYNAYKKNRSTNLKKSQSEYLTDDSAKVKIRFLQSLFHLIEDIKRWKNNYILFAPQSGKVTFYENIEDNQYVKPGETVFIVTPKSDKFYGDLEISQTDFGKVQLGQEVLIKMKSFPFEEYGIVKGKVISISEVPNKNGSFVAKVYVDLDRSQLLKKMHLKNGMVADAEIITEESSLLTRLLRSFLKIVNA